MTMEIDALHSGEPMRNGLDPCNTCADWLELKAENDSLRAQLAATELDSQRLDWLQTLDGRFYNIDRITAVLGVGFNRMPSLRDAIDVARGVDA